MRTNKLAELIGEISDNPIDPFSIISAITVLDLVAVQSDSVSDSDSQNSPKKFAVGVGTTRTWQRALA